MGSATTVQAQGNTAPTPTSSSVADTPPPDEKVLTPQWSDSIQQLASNVINAQHQGIFSRWLMGRATRRPNQSTPP
ncbi:MAG: hypothetical protein R3C68_01250 [Myxococcota bacterium]